LRIGVIGCGYVGLVTGACLADVGHEVVCTDNDLTKIDALNRGEIPIYEAHLDEVVERNHRQGRLTFMGNMAEAVSAVEATFICVGTPPLEDGSADLSSIENVARLIATEARGPQLVIEKSTVPAQTGQRLKRALEIYNHSGINFRVASNPEFLRESTAVMDFLHPPRIVVGVEDETSEQQLRSLFDPILHQTFQCPVHEAKCPPTTPPTFIVTSINSAEIIKHASNSFLAMKICYANLLADLCDRLGADVEQVTQAMGLDPRIGPSFLSAGLGFGGFCLPKDVQAFIHLGEKAGIDFGLLRQVELINKKRIDRFLERAKEELWILKGKQVGMLGISFKPDTDDIRFAPSLELIKRLQGEGASVRAFDPQALQKAKALFPALEACGNEYQAAEGADALMIVTEWPQFKDLDWKRVRKSMARPLVLDGRNLLDPAQMRAWGFEYFCMGRPNPGSTPAGG